MNEKNINIYNNDSINLYSKWDTPTTIICDGPYGISGFKGDTVSYKDLADWYEPHIKAWSKKATAQTTLWFWNTEIGWASVHPILEKYGWEYVSCNTWDKGMSHVAGNVNTKTIKHLPIVTEVCVQYVKKPFFKVGKEKLSMQDWLRYEWKRTGLPFSKTNEACGVVNAATRKYFTSCHLWYMPPTKAFEKIVDYANKNGKENGKPYFLLNKQTSPTGENWDKLKPKFKCPVGKTNVWTINQLKNKERLKDKNKVIHLNQKPLEIIKELIDISSDEGDVVWDPFGGLFTSAIACIDLKRSIYTSEINKEIFLIAKKRIEEHLNQI